MDIKEMIQTIRIAQKSGTIKTVADRSRISKKIAALGVSVVTIQEADLEPIQKRALSVWLRQLHTEQQLTPLRKIQMQMKKDERDGFSAMRMMFRGAEKDARLAYRTTRKTHRQYYRELTKTLNQARNEEIAEFKSICSSARQMIKKAEKNRWFENAAKFTVKTSPQHAGVEKQTACDSEGIAAKQNNQFCPDISISSDSWDANPAHPAIMQEILLKCQNMGRGMHIEERLVVLKRDINFSVTHQWLCSDNDRLMNALPMHSYMKAHAAEFGAGLHPRLAESIRQQTLRDYEVARTLKQLYTREISGFVARHKIDVLYRWHQKQTREESRYFCKWVTDMVEARRAFIMSVAAHGIPQSDMLRMLEERGQAACTYSIPLAIMASNGNHFKQAKFQKWGLIKNLPPVYSR